mgnify:CR=1 FL=1
MGKIIGIDLGTTHCAVAQAPLDGDAKSPEVQPITQLVARDRVDAGVLARNARDVHLMPSPDMAYKFVAHGVNRDGRQPRPVVIPVRRHPVHVEAMERGGDAANSSAIISISQAAPWSPWE